MPPKIELERCTGCGICVFHCGVNALALITEQSLEKAKLVDDCVDCFICEAVCPEKAIEIFVRKTRA